MFFYVDSTGQLELVYALYRVAFEDFTEDLDDSAKIKLAEDCKALCSIIKKRTVAVTSAEDRWKLIDYVNLLLLAIVGSDVQAYQRAKRNLLDLAKLIVEPDEENVKLFGNQRLQRDVLYWKVSERIDAARVEVFGYSQVRAFHLNEINAISKCLDVKNSNNNWRVMNNCLSRKYCFWCKSVIYVFWKCKVGKCHGGVRYYCRRKCLKEDWKYGNHKETCRYRGPRRDPAVCRSRRKRLL